MYDEFKNKPELRKVVTHITLSITVLTIIAVIIRLFTKNPPESWVSALNIAGTISIVYYMGLFNSKFTYLKWLAISKKYSYKMFLVFIAIIFFAFPFVLLFAHNFSMNIFHTENILVNDISRIFIIIIMNFIFILMHAMSFTMIILLLMAVASRRIIKKEKSSI
ncbi:hypothetical protein [Staphylococcus gallinarum]|uniref:hypothetical protein n=1 Tax=Staphylococcus gallinarum TaxID=1293 RepID=UPI001E611D8E|nr:hypothetical protein [Staphylococcus gallinarum]MCD8920854.1 hypothetical protein [Staphylococcus gallinarum]UEH01125.1 hypothetical protein K3U27_02010 [Staphylococcus gallinarum]